MAVLFGKLIFLKKKFKMEKLTIKDIFKEDEIKSSESNNKTSSRIIELSKALEQKGEIIKESIVKPVNEEELKKEAQRNKEIARIDEYGTNNQFSANIPGSMYYGQTVNSFLEKKGETVNSNFDTTLNPATSKVYNPNYTYLQPAEGLRLAISRVLNSGAPVNDIGFYEEVNRELAILGFNPKSPLDIKQSVKQMIKD